MDANTGDEKTTSSAPKPPAVLAPDKDATVVVDMAAKANVKPKEGDVIERAATAKDYLRVFSYASKWDFLAYCVGGLASIGAGVTLPLMNVVFGRFIREFSDFGNLSNMSASDFRNTVDTLSLWMLGLFLARWFLNYLNKLCFRMIGIRLSSAIRLHYLQCLFAQSVGYLDAMEPGLATSTITSTADTLQLGISEKLGIFTEFMATIVAAIIIAFTWNWRLTLVVASVFVVMIIIVGGIIPFISAIGQREEKARNKATGVASETLSGLRMVTACGAESRMADKYAAFVDQAAKYGRQMSPFIATLTGTIFMGVYGSFGLAFWYGVKLFTDNKVDSVGTISVVLFSVLMVAFSLERVTTPLLAINKAKVAACEFFIIIDAPRPPKGHLTEPDVNAHSDIVFEKVNFAYPSRPHVKVLDDLDLRVETGKITAIVGPSGSGKSTIVGLVQRWYNLSDRFQMEKVVDEEKKAKQKKKEQERAKRAKKGLSPSESDEESGSESESHSASADASHEPVTLSGSITTAGKDLHDIELKWWRSQIGLVQQEPFLFNESIYSNVITGLTGSQWENESEETKRKLVKDACKEAFADEFIDKLPLGYDTVVGDSGAKLSGGQRQRIAIARSIVRKPKILILDEATSAIDVRGEKIVQAALDRVAKNRTTITIAHRLSTIKKADRIVVLKKGKIAESGTHDSLIAIEGGVYSTLVNAQALSLGDPTDADEDVTKADEDSEPLVREKSKAQSELRAGQATDEDVGVPPSLSQKVKRVARRITGASPQPDSEKQATVSKKAEPEKARSMLQSFGLFFVETPQSWWLKCVVVCFAAMAGASMPFQAWLFALCIGAFQYTFDPPKLLSEARFYGLMYMTLAISVGISYFGGFMTAHRLATLIRSKYQKQYFRAIVYQKTSFFDEEDHSQGTMTSRSASDPQQLEQLMGVNMASVYIAIFTIIGSITIGFSFAWKLALVTACVILPILLFTSYWRFKYEIEFDKMNSEVFAESSKFASESIGAFRTVTAFTLEDTITERFDRLCQGHVNQAFKKARWVSCLFGFADSITIGCQGLVLYYGSRLIANGEFGITAFFVSMMAIMNGSEAAGQSLSYGPNAAQTTASANRIINMRESAMAAEYSDNDRIADGNGGVQLDLQDIKFKYPTRDAPVFNGLSLSVEKGQFAALVGASGCGKTSIISLLERFYDLDGGRILCNGRDIADMNIHAYRKSLSLVAQEATLFKGTIRENILLGVDGTVSDERLHQICQDASIHEFIMSLPEGYNTNIGSRGVTLSGGQKQRIAIARALIRDPKLLLLDEATSSLDSESEKLVQAAFERAGKGRTMVVVAHRLATVQNADVIFVLGEGGKLLEKGSHVELLKQKGAYYQMCQSQALDR